jgi:hypothetical protein
MPASSEEDSPSSPLRSRGGSKKRDTAKRHHRVTKISFKVEEVKRLPPLVEDLRPWGITCKYSAGTSDCLKKPK